MRVTPLPARFLVTVGLLLAIVGGGLWALETTVLDRDRLTGHAEALLREAPLRDALAARLAVVLAPPAPRVEGAPPAPPNPARPLADAAVREPPFRQAFAGALSAVHARVVDGSRHPIVFAPGLVGRAVAEARGDGEPAPVALSLPADDLPDAHRSIALLELAVTLLLPAGVLLIGVGIAASEHRARVVMRIGRFTIVAGVLALVGLWALPRLVLQPLGGWGAVAGIVMGAGTGLTAPALALVAVGGLLLAAGHLRESSGRRRTLATLPRHRGRTGTEWAGRA